MIAVLVAGPPDARAESTFAEIDIHHRARVSLRRHWRIRTAVYTTTADTVRVCTVIPTKPLERCESTVDVRVAAMEVPEDPEIAPPSAAELNLIQSLVRTAADALALRSKGRTPIVLHGIEPESVLTFYIKREWLRALGRITGIGVIGNAARGLLPTSSIRAIAEGQAIEQSRARATYIQIEELKGPSPITPAPAYQAALGATGLGLFASGIAGQNLLNGSLGDALVIHPLLWPLGIEISGRFMSP